MTAFPALLAGVAGLVAVSAVPTGSAGSAPPAPLEVFARLPEFGDVQISPGGHHLAAKAYIDGKYRVLIYDLENPGRQPLMATPTNQEVNWLRWKRDDRLLTSLWFPERRWGTAVVETRLFALSPDGSGLKSMVPPARDEYPVQIADRVVDYLPDDPQHILMAFNPQDPRFPRLYRVNVETARRSLVEGGEAGIYWWTVDQQGRARIGQGLDDQRMRTKLYFRAQDEKDWTLVSDRHVDEGPVFHPLMFDHADPDLLYVYSDHAGATLGLYPYRVSSREFLQPLFLHPEVDAGEVLLDPGGRQIIGIRFVDDIARTHWLDPKVEGWVEDVRLRIGARHAQLTSASLDYRRLVVYVESPDVPGRYYLYEPADKRLRLFADTYPALRDQPQARMRVTSYRARDGLEIPAYLTLPPGMVGKPPQPLPAVVFPHGGPASRDMAAWDGLVQFMASRGYAVLQMNFRGSGGYGTEFRRAGARQWGKAMQDDVTDGTRWLMAEGIADPERTCIVGWSYGGYAALMGVVREPDLYRCAVSIAGVSDLRRLIDERRQYLFDRIATRMIGDSWKDRDALRTNSPVNRAGDIRSPVLLLHGTRDRVAPPTHSAAMAKALARAGKPHEYIELQDSDHSVLQGEQRLTLFSSLERFLARHIGGAPAESARAD